MADINVDVNLPNAISVDVTSPTYDLNANVYIPGAQGPRGEKGNPTTINNLSAENIIITGSDGNIVYNTGLNTIFISGNSGYFQSAVNSLTTNLNSTGSALNTKIDNLSGYVNSQDTNISNNLVSTGSSLQSNINTLSSNLNSTGSNLENKITSLSGNLTGNYLTTNVASNTYATINNLNSTGNTLNSSISSLSGTLTSNYATIINLASTGSSLQNQINNLDNVYATDASVTAVANNLASTGSTLETKIGSLSGTLTSNYATITNLASTGATLNNNINLLSGTLTSNYATITNLASTGSTLVSSINSINSAFTGFTGNLDLTYATNTQLQNTGSTLSQNINSLSGTLTGNYYLKSNPSGFITGVDLSSYLTSSTASSTYATITNLNSTGNTLNSSITSLSGLFTGYTGTLDATFATDLQLSSTGTTLNNTINSLSGTVTGNYVTKSNGQFTNRPTVNGTGILLSGEAASLPTTILYTTGNQIKSGRLIIGDDAISIVDPNSPYTLSLQTNSPRTWLEILNNSGANKGVFFGINSNDFEQYNWQGGDIVFFTSENVSDGVARLTIKNNGKVGIGTSSPSEKLEVAGNIIANNLIYTTGNQIKTGHLVIGDAILDRSSPYTLSLQSNNGLTLLEILNNGGSGQGAQVCMNGNEFELYNNQGGDIVFYTAENPNSGIERLYIKNNGNIGIGTNIPSEKLEVVGNILANNLVYNTGNQTISGNKTFDVAPVVSGNPFITGNLSLYATTTNLASTGSTLTNSINSLSGTLTGNYLTSSSASSTYATITNLSSTGNTLNTKINSLSGTLTGNYLTTSSASNTYSTIINLASTGSSLNSNINSLSGLFTGYTGTLDATFASDIQLANTGSTLVTSINSLSGTLTGNYVTKNNGLFTNRPTVNGTNILISGESIISGDLTGFLPYPTVNKLQGYKLDLNGGAADGQVLQWNAASSSWKAGAIPAGGNGGGGLTYYFDFANRSGIAPTGGLPTTGDHALSLLGTQYVIGSGQATSNELDPRFVDRLLCSFVTASGNPQVTNIPAGLWDFNIWANVDNASAIQCSIKAVVNIYNPTNSTYRYLASSDDVYLYETDTIAQYILNATVPQTGIQSYERIYVQLFGKKYTTNNRTITLYFDSYRPSHVHTTIPSIAGDGVVKVINGVFQSPATGIFNADVDNNANIAQSKIANLATDLTTIRNNIASTGSTLNSSINSLSGILTSTYATITNLASTGSTLNTKIDNLSGYINSTNSNIVFTTGDQNISGDKTFRSHATRFGKNIIGQVLITDDNYGNDLGIMTDQDEVIAVKMSDGSFLYGGGTPPNAPIRVNSSGTLNVRNDLTFSRDTTITTGAAVSFTKTNNGNQIDYFGGITLTRGKIGPLYNPSYTYYFGGNGANADWINPRYTKWNADGWSDLTNIRSRKYDNFITAVGGNIGNAIVGLELVVYDINYDQYYLIKFSSWTQGGNGGGFAYIRSLVSFNDTEISKITGYLEVAQNTTFDSSVKFDGPVLFKNDNDYYGGNRYHGSSYFGQTAYFNQGIEATGYGANLNMSSVITLNSPNLYMQSNNARFTQSQVYITGSTLNLGDLIQLGGSETITQSNNTEDQVIDYIDTNVQITRGSHQGIYNPDQENAWNGNGPSYTEWNADGWSDLTNLSSRTYYDLYYVPQLNNQIGNYIVGQELIMHDTFNDKYYKFYFTNWMQGASTSWQSDNDNTPPITYAGFEYTRTQIISAYKSEINGSNVGGYLDLKNRLFINGTGVLLSGEAGQVPDTIVQTSGTQTISGSKTFTAATTFNSGVDFNNNITVSQTGIFSSMDVSVDEMSISGLNLTVTNGTGIFNNGIDLNNSTIINAAPQIINVSSNFIISGNYNSRMIMANSSNTITGRIVSGNATGFNVSITQVGTGQIQITGSGNGISIGSFASAYKTAGQYATISLLHTGNNRYIMYGNTA